MKLCECEWPSGLRKCLNIGVLSRHVLAFMSCRMCGAEGFTIQSFAESFVVDDDIYGCPTNWTTFA